MKSSTFERQKGVGDCGRSFGFHHGNYARDPAQLNTCSIILTTYIEHLNRLEKQHILLGSPASPATTTVEPRGDEGVNLPMKDETVLAKREALIEEKSHVAKIGEL